MLVDVLAPLALALVAFAYFRRCTTLAARGAAVPGWRRACFAAGIVVLALADLPPLATVAEELVVAHMAQHLLIGDLAGLLVVLGLTGPLLQPLLAIRGLGWLRLLGNPLVALPLWALNLYLWHLGALYQGVLDSPVLHLAQHAAFFGFGIAMWMPLLGPLPAPGWFSDAAKLVYVIAVRLCAAVLGNVLIWSGSVLYPDYATGRARVGDRAARRPGRGRQPDDDRDRRRDAGAVHLALLPRRQPQRRKAGAPRARRARGRRARPRPRRPRGLGRAGGAAARADHPRRRRGPCNP